MPDRPSVVIPLRPRDSVVEFPRSPRVLERPLLWAAKAALTFILIFPAPSWPRPVRSLLDVLQRRRRGSRPK